MTTIGEFKTYGGPWQRSEDLSHVSVWSKYLKPTDFGQVSFTLSGYSGDWHPTEQVPERAIGSPVCPDAFCSLDPTAAGNTSRWIAGTQMVADSWDASAYLQFYDWHMQSNPTYDAQINQFDRRTTAGGRFNRTLIDTIDLGLNVGAEFRYDDIGPVGLDENEAGRYVANISNNDIRETSVGAYAEGSWRPTTDLRLLAGLRADYYDFDVATINPTSFAGSATDSQVSPGAGIAYAASNNVELYASWGRGFHSNDARGAVNHLDPIDGLAPGTGYEAGARFEIGDVKLTTTYWWLNLDSELIFVGDSNSVEPRGGSNRQGYELTMFWKPLDWLGVDAVFTDNQAYYADDSEGRYIEGSLENASQIGFSAVRDRWEAALRVRYLGPYALTSDNAHRAGSSTTVNLRGSYQLGSITFYAELFNLLDNDGKDIVYFYEAYVDGFDPPGLTSEDIDCASVNCRMSRATEPRTLRFGAKWLF